MPRITKIYTKQGDSGSTRLGGGQKVSKTSPRIAAYGTVDELNSVIGVALASGLDPGLVEPLSKIQNELFHLGSDLCILEEDKKTLPVPRIEPHHVEALEGILDRLTVEVGPLENFILPGGSIGAAHLHVARTVCRRAERLVVALAEEETVGSETVRYLNRLSDALFVMARFENKRKGIDDVCWDSRS
ncbi:MAG: cob(I)yrinic acid a,c-diamide adenosyltransferase [Acidobacteria bacterium]|nr:cob(I)yrinic acid a,c-diamide adenosyltransferase [Acidobacteriota bacterium]NIM62765.1 cob(I)yrinic acid a,c-diamide adenosyltransferase [Acidobacteriota bacterium]NIO59065.1 cob(I)yrinic acid a,c-diamide adenosyltransferase [Acidobacteriota bacterium]NIQ30104.1 cob(I)yrinic acid a,c-diamide adenosyltransferase [Acidobacteriota bacterium]NIQ84907.1 cob(I)yrinic acid a,c-diamide adenosyltransferase [Acidobacteriota bacterium]